LILNQVSKRFTYTQFLSLDRTFSVTFSLPDNPKKPAKPSKTCGNSIFLARKYVDMIESVKAKSQADLARQLGISRQE